MTVADLMTRDVPTCRIGDTLNQAVQLMCESRCGAVAVLDDGQRVVGVVTDRDACMATYTQGARMADIPVSTAMSSTVVTCPPASSIEEAENLMMAHDVRRLVVVDPHGRLLGMLSLDEPSPAFTPLPQSSLDTFETPRSAAPPITPFAAAKSVTPTARRWRVGTPLTARPKF